MIQAGEPAPDFALRDQDGQKVTLESLRGRRFVLVFYPADFSPVCTDQLNVYQEVLGELEERGATLYGVSVDSAFSHKAFQQHLGLTIPLLADFHPKGDVAQKFGLYNAEKGVTKRATVIIDKAGKVAWAQEHEGQRDDALILAELAKLSA